jgi:integrase
MLRVLPEPARVIAATAAFTGTRTGEIQGMRWEAWHDGAIYIETSVWNGIVGLPKSKVSKRPVPVIPHLAALWREHHLRLGSPSTGWMFPAENGQPLRLNNILTRQIRPALERCNVCGESKLDHDGDDHEYQRDLSLPEWHGWHAFRRGLASNLNRLKVDDSVIQRILRHANVSVTQTHCIQTVDADAVAAMDALEVSFAGRSQKAAVLVRPRVN